MEHTRSPRSSSAHGSEEEASPVPLSVLLEGVTYGAERKDVDALLAGLARPLAADESPRGRADFLLSLLESHTLRSMRGSRGVTLQAAAVRALKELGHPYALEIPPDALDRPRRDARTLNAVGERSIPVVGIVLALIGTAPAVMFGPFGILLALPTLMTLLGGATEVRGLQTAGWVMMVLLTLGLFCLGGYFIWEDARSSSDSYDGLTTMLGIAALAPTPFLGVGAYLMRRPAWRIEDEES